MINAGIKNTIYVVAAQSISLLLGITRTLILPIMLGITNFGYWQVYMLYLSYVGIFALGYNDGIYLRYGKYEYDELPKNTFGPSIRLFVVFQLAIMFLAIAVISWEPDPSKQISILWASINIPIAGLTGVLIYVLQITNQLKKYSFYTILDKVIVLITIIAFLLLRLDNFLGLIIVDTFARIFVLGLMINSCREIIFGKGISYKYALKEISVNVSVGIRLMLANFAGMLMFGIGKFLVERTASVEQYGIYSFAISTMNLVLVLITAIGLVIYPTLNRLDKNNYPKYFDKLNNVLAITVFGLLTVIFPLRLFILRFMVDFISIYDYLSLIFAMIFVQSKMQILINPYYKLLRKETMMLRANLVGVVVVGILVTPLYILTQSVTMVAIGTLFAMLISLYFSEIYLKKELGIFGNKNIIAELFGLFIFIILGLISNFYMGLFVYLIIYLVFAIKQSNNIKDFARYFLRR